MNKTPLCYAPFTNIFVSSKNRYAFCCAAKRVSAESPQQFWTSQFAVETRKKMLDGQFPNECISCEIKHKQGLSSDRDDWVNFNSDEKFDKQSRNYWKHLSLEINLENGNSSAGPMHLDYRPSNKCNLKCRMCSSYSSNLIEKEVIENPELQQWMHLPSESNDKEEFYNFIRQHKIKHVKLLGGEPAIEPLSVEFMDELLQANLRPTIHVTTNCTTLNKKFYSTLKKFEVVHLSISVDGTGKTFEYIRTNSNWSIVKDNVERIFEEKYANSYIFNVVITPYNIFNLSELLTWFRELRNKYNFSMTFLNYGNTESDKKIQDLSCVLPHHIDETLSELYKFAKIFKRDSNIINLISMLEKAKFNQQNYEKFVQFNNLLDKIRKTNFVDLDSRFREYV